MTGPAPLSCHKMSANLFAVNYATTNHQPNVNHHHPNVVRRHQNVNPQTNVYHNHPNVVHDHLHVNYHLTSHIVVKIFKKFSFSSKCLPTFRQGIKWNCFLELDIQDVRHFSLRRGTAKNEQICWINIDIN